MPTMPPIHPGEILFEEFLEPLCISQYRLAKDISVPPRRINEIVHGKRAISADTALRLARYFGTTDQFWLNLQTRYNLELQKDYLGKRLEAEVRVLERQVWKFVPVVGCQPNPKDESHLFEAIRLDLPAVAAYLLKNGANIHATNKYGNTPPQVAAKNNAAEVTKALLGNGADVHATDNQGKTLLHVTAKNNAAEVTKVLLDNGADVHATDNQGNTPLHIAAENNAAEVAKVLLSNRANINAKDIKGWTPLHLSALKNAAEVTAVLLSNGANVNAKSDEGWTPLHIAKTADAAKVVEILHHAHSP